MTHRNEPSRFCSLVVWHEDQLIYPIQVFNVYPVEFALVSHSGIAHQDDNVAEERSAWLLPFDAVARNLTQS